MSFDYRELMTQILAAQEEQPCPGGVSCAGNTHVPDCEQCNTTKHPIGCEKCSTTMPTPDSPGCKPCNTTKHQADGFGSQYTQDLTFLRQQLRDALSAG